MFLDQIRYKDTEDTQGVVICVTSLVMALAQDHLEAYAVCYQKAVDRLNRVRIPIYLICARAKFER